MGDLDRINPTNEAENQEEEAAPSDGRKLGFGHRAYQPDPKARYTFNPEVVRPLPVNERLRWR